PGGGEPGRRLSRWKPAGRERGLISHRPWRGGRPGGGERLRQEPDGARHTGPTAAWGRHERPHAARRRLAAGAVAAGAATDAWAPRRHDLPGPDVVAQSRAARRRGGGPGDPLP